MKNATKPNHQSNPYTGIMENCSQIIIALPLEILKFHVVLRKKVEKSSQNSSVSEEINWPPPAPPQQCHRAEHTISTKKRLEVFRNIRSSLWHCCGGAGGPNDETWKFQRKYLSKEAIVNFRKNLKVLKNISHRDTREKSSRVASLFLRRLISQKRRNKLATRNPHREETGFIVKLQNAT